MFILIQITNKGGASAFGPFDSTADHRLMEIFTKGGYENDTFPVNSEHGIRRGWEYKNKNGHRCIVCEINPMDSPSIILEDLWK